MKTRDNFCWTVLEEDNRYGPAIQQNIDYTNEDEDTMTDVLKKHVKKNNCVVEVGVHVGFTTKWLANKFSTVHSFDFDNDVLECFRINMKKFGCNNVVIHPYGLGEIEKMVAVADQYPSGRGPLGAHIDIKNNNKLYKIKSLDQLSIENVDLAVIDTEGYEYFVLQGAQETIKKYKPVLVIEFHKKRLSKKFFGVDQSTTEEFLEKKLGYKFVSQVTKNDRLYVHKEQI